VACPLGALHRRPLGVNNVVAQGRNEGSEVCGARTGNMLDMTRSFATPLLLLFNSPAQFWFCMPRTRLLWLLLGGEQGEVDVLIGNKRCAFLPFSYLPTAFSRHSCWGGDGKCVDVESRHFCVCVRVEESSSLWMKGWF